MGFFKKLLQKRKIKRDIEILRLKNEKNRLRSQINRTKAMNLGRNTKLFKDTLADIEEIKDLTGENQNALIDFLDTDSGKKIINSLISKFGGGKEAAEGIMQAVKTLSPEQKKALIDELIGAGKK